MYNTRRHHSTLSMTPYRKLRTQIKISNQVALFPVIQLEKLTDLYQKLFPLPGYQVSANDHKNKISFNNGKMLMEKTRFSMPQSPQ
ncbi:MAG: hypothetical protein QME85_05050 [Candidatus Saccharicenans sp.]|nr:hypothetical protein [Candidatus Saccharicenans sp.]